MAGAQKEYVFQDPSRLTNYALWAIYVLIAVEAISLVPSILEFGILRQIADHSFSDRAALVAAAQASDQRQAIMGGAEMLTIAVSGVLTLMWIYRANANAHVLGAKDMTFTAGWAVGWYFIPFASLWKPYQAMKEIWQASHGGEDWKTLYRPAVMPWWWAFWLITNVLSQASFRLSVTGEGAGHLIGSNVTGMMGSVTNIAGALLLIPIIRAVTAMQTSRPPATPAMA